MAEWILEKEKDGISVSSRKIDNSNLKETLSTIIIKSTISKTAAVLMDIPSRTVWSENINKGNAKVLQQDDDGSLIGHLILNVPWPLKNRDMVAKYTTTKNDDDGSILIEIKGLPDFIARSRKLIRIEKVYTSWLIKKQGVDSVHITYTTSIDPGGKIPDKIVNTIAVEGPLKAMTALKKYIEGL